MFRIANLSVFDSLQNSHNKSIGYSGESFAISNAPKRSDDVPNISDVGFDKMWGDFYTFSTNPSSLEYYGIKESDLTDEERTELGALLQSKETREQTLKELKDKNITALKERIEQVKQKKKAGELKSVFVPVSEADEDDMYSGLWDNVEDKSLLYPNNYTAPQNLYKSGQHRYQTIPKITYEEAFEESNVPIEQTSGKKLFGHTYKLKDSSKRPKYLSCYTDDGSVYVELKPGSGNYEFVGGYGDIIDIPNPYDSTKKYQIVADDDGVVRSRLVANGRSRAVTQNDADSAYGKGKYVTLNDELARLSQLTIPQRMQVIYALSQAVTNGDDVYVLLKETTAQGKTYLKTPEKGEAPSFMVDTKPPKNKNTPYILLPNEEIRSNYDYLLRSMAKPHTSEGEQIVDDTDGIMRSGTYKKMFYTPALDKIKSISPETKSLLLGNLERKENSLLAKMREEPNGSNTYGFGIDETSGDVEVVRADEQSGFDMFLPFTFYKDNKDTITRFLSVVPKDELNQYLSAFGDSLRRLTDEQKTNVEMGLTKIVLSPKPVAGLEIDTKGEIRISDGGDIDNGSTFIPFTVVKSYFDDFMDMFTKSGMEVDELSNVNALKYRSKMLKDVLERNIDVSKLPTDDIQQLIDTTTKKDGVFSGLSIQEILDKLNQNTMDDGRVLSNPLGLMTKLTVSDDVNKVTPLITGAISDIRDLTHDTNKYSMLEDYLESGGGSNDFTKEVYGQLMEVITSPEFKDRTQGLIKDTKVIQDLEGLAKMSYEDYVERVSDYLKGQSSNDEYAQSVLRGANVYKKKTEAEKFAEKIGGKKRKGK